MSWITLWYSYYVVLLTSVSFVLQMCRKDTSQWAPTMLSNLMLKVIFMNLINTTLLAKHKIFIVL